MYSFVGENETPIAGGWPGSKLTEENGWYTVSLSAPTMAQFCYIINNGSGTQTSNTYVTFPSGTTYELWTWVEKKWQDGNEVYEAAYSFSSVESVESPEVNGNKVTFRYKNEWASSVYLAGTMNGWSDSATKMSNEDGVFTCEETLEHGEYQYKFVVKYAEGTQNESSDWITDPSNPLYVEEKDDDGNVKNTNSLVYVPGDTTYNYTVHYYDPNNADQTAETPDLYVWELGIKYAKTDHVYTYESGETDNGIRWLTTTFSVPYRNLGIIGRQTAGSWDGGKDIDRSYQLAGSSSTGAELWYIYGQGIYDKKPMFGDVETVEAALCYDSMDYTRNNVLSITVNGSEDGARLVSEAYVDASALGMSDQLKIDPELMEISLSVTEDTAPGSYELPITVTGNNGSKATGKVTVVVTEKSADENDFDWDEAVIYFMVTDRFFDGNNSNNAANGSETFDKGDEGLYHGGDFAGVKEKLDYLEDLGVNTIWITPIVENIKGVTVGDGTGDVPYNAAYHGYWASDFTKLNPALGTDEEFQALIGAAHAKGMKIMVDVVVNHAGYGAEDNFPGMLRETVADQNDFVHGGGQADLPDFLTENPEVRKQIIEWQVNWLEKGIDYFRVDTVKHVDNTTWMAFKNELTKANPKFKMIGEYFDAGYASNNGGTLGSGQMDSLLDFNFNDWAASFVKGNISGVEQSLTERNAALNNTYLTGQFLSSHDENGFKWNLTKSGMAADAADAATMVAATLQITAKGQPVIYYGEEIGQTGENNYPYQTNRYDFNWSEVESGSNKTYAHYKKMLGIREQYSEVFAKGDRKVVDSSNADGYDVVSRSYNGETVYVGMNIGSEAKEIKISVDSNGITGYKDLYGGQTYTVDSDGTVTVNVPAAADGGTIVLAAGSYADVLVAPELTIAKGTDEAGKVSALPYQLTHVAEDGSKTAVDVTYSMEAVEGVTLDGEGCKITVNQAFDGDEITLTATAADNSELSVTFTVKVVEDKNEITLRLHYTRKNSDYTGWNVWAWADGMEGKGYEFDATGENGEKVVTFTLKGREITYFNYIIRKSVEGKDWAEKDLEDDQKIDLTDVLSGTVDYYVESGVSGGKRVLGDDVLLGAKILSVTYNRTNNTIKVVTGMSVIGKPDEVFTLKGANGKAIPVSKVSVSGNKKEYTLTLGEDLSSMEAMAKKYILAFDGYDYPVAMPSVYSSDEFEGQFTYEGNDLGATWSKEKTTFKVWAPTADKVEVNLYKSGTKGTDDKIESIDMTKGEKGIWTAVKTGDLNGTYYTYTAVQDGKSAEACDPYARTTGVNGDRAMVIDLDSTDPAGWANDSGPNQGMSYNDSVIYELHVRDFSIDKSSGISAEHKGKFLGLTEKGTTNTTGQTTGLDYLVDLGVTHIHLLPSYDYGSVDETRLDEEQYNWGYDPVNYNVPEGSYSTDPYNGATRVKEMKQMVKTLHDNDINVIMDVVYNHVYNADEFCFNQLVPQYFSRTNADGSYSNASGCGNDTASERAMVKKYIVDSVNYWADEYHIDGFRFDLVGLLDVDTINEVVDTVHQKHPDAVFYGEGWTMNSAVSKPNITMATQANSAKTPNFAYFSDTIRDAIKGDNFNVANTGFVNGAIGLEEKIAACFMAATSWCKSPTQTINYASCHDNYTLWDKISVSRSDASEKDRIRMNNLAAAIYMTAEGIPLIHAGEEILRTKPSVNPTPDNHGVEHNSYNLPDSVNSIKWGDLDKEAYRNVRDYYKGLIAFRKNHAALRLTSAADVTKNVKYNWITNEVVMFVIGGKDTIASEVSDGIVVIFNATDSEQAINLYNNYGVAEGTWNICINDQKAGIETLDSVTVTGTAGQVKVAPISAMVLVKGEAKDPDTVYDKNELLNRKLQALKDLIAAYENLEQGNYTDESWKKFTDALAAAKSIADKSDVTVEEIDSAMDQLRAAYNGLEVPAGTVDKNKLSGLVEQCSKLTEQGNYTYDSWEKFTQALEKAKEVLAETEATQEEVDQAYEVLQTAYKGLAEYTGPVDNSKLKDLVDKYGKIEQGDYTDESWAAFQEALKEAERVVNDPDATQADIDRARAALEKAYADLDEAPHGLWIKWADASMFTTDEDGADHITYTGKAIKPGILVYDGRRQLKEKTDYTVTYKQNINEGEAVVTVKGKGNYSQSLQQSFFIDKVDISTLEIADLYGVVAANNAKQIQPKPVVKYNGKALKLKTDYTVAYENPETDGKTPGTYKVKLQSNPNSKNFTGSKEIQMILADKAETVLMSKVKINTILAQPYEWDEITRKGKVQTPNVTVTYGKETLIRKDDSQPQESWDYEVIYDTKHTEAGETATITVKGSGKKYVGEKTASFKITGTALKANKVSLKDVPKAGLVYTGAEQKPEVQVADMEEKDYPQYSVEYQKNMNVGTATVVVTGINGYTGKVKKTFKITAFDILTNVDDLFAFGVDNEIKDQISYAKGGSKLTDENVNARFKVNGVVTQELEQGKDYTLSYKKNTAVGDASVSIKGKGNYKGTIKDIPFTIIPRDLSKLEDNAVAGDILEKNAKKYNTVIPVITDLNGKKLKNKTDFTVDKATAYTDEEGNVITGVPAVGSVIKVTAEAKGNNYSGKVSATFRVVANDKNIAAAKVKIEPQIYTGAEVKLNYNDITVEMKENGEWVAIDKSNFEITGYSNNTKKGTAKVTIHGIGEYGGTKTVSFKINAKPMILGTR
ncbi:MAG: type I pullulanase [Lachnospiraceae bacterium]|nr:type I pullulanase [Lachnospiraceae bacterium]